VCVDSIFFCELKLFFSYIKGNIIICVLYVALFWKLFPLKQSIKNID